MQLIPAIDLRDGRCVRLYQGRFDRETRYDVDPVTLVKRYRDAGHRHVHVVDLDGAKDGSPANQSTLARLCDVDGVTLQVGGGLRDAEQIDALFALGVQRVVLGSIAVKDPALCRGFLRDYGGEHIVFAFDVRIVPPGEPEVMVSGWQEGSGKTLWNTLNLYADAGLQHVLCTDVGKDGALTGPNFDLYRACTQWDPQLKFQASGGVRDTADLDALVGTGVASAIAGRALLENRIDLDEVAAC